MNKLILIPLLLLASCGGGSPEPDNAVEAANPQGSCLTMHPGGKPPVLVNKAYEQKTHYRCRRSFDAVTSGVTRQPLWVAEVINDASIRMARSLERVDDFHPDEDIPAGDRAELSDYRGSGYDRGHMAPNGDMPTRESQVQSFGLSLNIVPQNAELNRGAWADLEKSVRRQTSAGPVFIVTGPGYKGQLQKIKDRLFIPTHVWKAIYQPGKGATVFVATNDATATWTTMTVDQFTTVFGIDPFPGMPPELRNINASNEKIPGPDDKALKGDAKTDAGSNLVRHCINGQWVSKDQYSKECGGNAQH